MKRQYLALLLAMVMAVCVLPVKHVKAETIFPEDSTNVSEDVMFSTNTLPAITYEDWELTAEGTYEYDQKEGVAIKLHFKAPKSGIYLLELTCLTELEGAMTEISYTKGISSVGNSNTKLSRYFVKGKSTVMILKAGDTENVYPRNMKIQFRIKKLDNRIQKLQVDKNRTVTKKDYQDPQGILTFDDIKKDGYAWMTFTPDKTGYYRVYSANKGKIITKANGCWFDANGEYIEPGNSTCFKKLKKGKTYIYHLDFAVGLENHKFSVQYAKKIRTIELHYNYPFESHDFGYEYDVLSGSQLGVLQNPIPTEWCILGLGKTAPAYEFLGWYTKPKGGKKITANTKKCQKIMKLYAHWEKKK